MLKRKENQKKPKEKAQPRNSQSFGTRNEW